MLDFNKLYTKSEMGSLKTPPPQHFLYIKYMATHNWFTHATRLESDRNALIRLL